MDLPLNVLNDIKKALETGNKKKVNSFLGSRYQTNKRASLDSSLEPSTDRADALFRLFRASFLDSESKGLISSEQGLRALLMLGPQSEIPWMATDAFLSQCVSLDLSTVCLCISAIEQFLREARTVWSLKPNQQSTALDGSRAWLVKLTDTIVEIVISLDFGDESLHSRDKVLFQVISELLRTILSLTRTLDIRCFEAVMEKVGYCQGNSNSNDPSRTLSWLKLGLVLMPFLRPVDLERIRQGLSDVIYDDSFPIDDIPSIVGTSIDLSVVGTQSENSVETMSLWIEVIFSALSDLSVSPNSYSLLEDQIILALDRMDLRTLQVWSHGLSCASRQSKAKKWIKLNVAMFLFQSVYSNSIEMIQNSLGISLDRSANGDKFILECCDTVLNILPFGDFSSYNAFGNTNMMQALDGISYDGNGTFVDLDGGQEIDILSNIGRAIYQSIFLEKMSPANTSIQTEISKRAIRLLKVSDQILKVKDNLMCIQTILFSFVSMTIVYLELPSCRSSLGRTMQTYLSRTKLASDTFSNACNASCGVMNTVIKSFLQGDDLESDKFERLYPLCEILSDPLPHDIYSHLCAAMSPIPKARELILKSSRTLVDIFYTSFWNSKEGCGPSREKARSGIFGLLELVRQPSWGHCELEAWTHLSNSLVFDKPPLSITDRSWLYTQIEDLIENDELCHSASVHLLRALIIRSSYFFDEEDGGTHLILERTFAAWSDSSGSLQSRTNQVEDILTLQRLILSLLCYTAKSNIDRSLLFAKGREALLQSILMQRDNSYSVKPDAIKDFLEEACPRGDYLDDFTLNLCASFCQFSNTLKLLVEKSTQSMNKRSRSNIDSFPSMSSILEKIFSREITELQSSLNFDKDKYKLPVWLEAPTLPSGMVEGKQFVNPSFLLPVKMSLFDFAIELLFTPPLPKRGFQNAKALSQRIVLSIGHLLQSKEDLSKSNEEDSLLSLDTLNETAVPFLSASFVVIQNFILIKSSTLVEVEGHLIPTLQYCKALVHLSKSSMIKPCSELIESVWKVYQVIGGERGVIRFISFLEEHVPATRSLSKNDNNIDLLLSNRTGEDVDKSIQKIRQYIISALQSCLLMFSSWNQNQSENIDDVNAGSFGLKSSEKVVIAPDFLASLLLALSKDLRAGLDGNSGGITSQLYLSYVGTIEECAIALFTTRLEHKVICNSIVLLFMEVAEILCDILSTFPLDDAILFRSTFLVATSAFPSMCREILRRTFIIDDCQVRFNQFHRVFCIDKIMLSGTLTDSLSILSRWSSLRDPNVMPWADIAGQSHLESDGETEELGQMHSSTESVDSEPEMARTVRIPTVSDGEYFEGAASNAKRFQFRSCKIRLQTKETWSWSLSCTLLAIEEKWMESFQVMMSSDYRDSDLRLENSTWYAGFFRGRLNELLFSFQSACKFFLSTSSESRVGPSGESLVLEMLAMNLPSAPRVRLCSLLGHILTVLKHAIDIITEKFQDTESPGSARNELAFVEAACCLSAWLCADFDGTDISLGICRWQSILKRRKPDESSSAKHDDKKLISTMSELVFLAIETQAKLKKLNGLVQDIKKETVQIFDVLLPGGIVELSRLAMKKLTVMEKEFPAMTDRVNSLPDFPDSSDDTKTQEKKRARRDYRRKKTTVSRTRNRVVDMFFHLDQEVEEGGRKGGETFVDLEDFLVEG